MPHSLKCGIRSIKDSKSKRKICFSLFEKNRIFGADMIIKNAVMADQDQIVDLINKSDLGSVYFNNDKSKIEKIISKEIDLQNVLLF